MTRPVTCPRPLMAGRSDPCPRARSTTWRARVGTNLRGEHNGTGLRVGIACALFNGGITLRLLNGALDALAEAGTDRRDVTVAWAPGAFELPLVARAFAHAGKVDAVLCFGAVIRGDTGSLRLRGRASARRASSRCSCDRGRRSSSAC